MKTLVSILLICFTSFLIEAQSKIDAYVESGIELHNQGHYKEAIAMYKRALEIEPKSSLVNYEISFSYFELGEYEKAIEYSDKVLKNKAEHMIYAYITKGSSLDLLGKTKESIKLFEKAIKTQENHYLLYYNLALNYYKINELKKAEENVIKAIEANNSHSSSHLMLAHIHNEQGNTVQTLLASYFFLFLEPNSSRSAATYELLHQTFGKNVTVDEDKPNTINISLSPKSDSEFSSVELMVAMLTASKSLEKNEGKTNEELFVQNTESFFKVLGELKKDSNKNIWWEFYTTFFYKLAKSNHLETFCNYISQSGNKNAEKWLDENNDKLAELDNWLKN